MMPNDQAMQLAGELQKVKDTRKVLAYAETVEGRNLWELFCEEIDQMIEEEYRLVGVQYVNPLAHAACNRATMVLNKIKQLPKSMTNSANAQIEGIGQKLDVARAAQARFEQDQEATSKFDPKPEKETEA